MTKTRTQKKRRQQLKERKQKCKSGKDAYKDRISALIFMTNSKKSDSTHHKDLARAYKCPDCNYWHLTSRRNYP